MRKDDEYEAHVDDLRPFSEQELHDEMLLKTDLSKIKTLPPLHEEIELPAAKYDPEFDSPEARANFATRHIRNLNERRRRRDELIAQYESEVIVDMFPGKKQDEITQKRADSLKRKYEQERLITEEVEWLYGDEDELWSPQIRQADLDNMLRDLSAEYLFDASPKRHDKQAIPESFRSRASLFSLFLFDYLVAVLHPKHYHHFHQEFAGKLVDNTEYNHRDSRMISRIILNPRSEPRGQVDWEVMRNHYLGFAYHTRMWINERVGAPVFQLSTAIHMEIEYCGSHDAPDNLFDLPDVHFNTRCAE